MDWATWGVGGPTTPPFVPLRLLSPGIVGRIGVVQRKGSGAVDLQLGFRIDPYEMAHSGGHYRKAACGERFRRRFVELAAHADVQRPAQNRDVLMCGMRMRRDRVAGREQ